MFFLLCGSQSDAFDVSGYVEVRREPCPTFPGDDFSGQPRTGMRYESLDCLVLLSRVVEESEVVRLQFVRIAFQTEQTQDSPVELLCRRRAVHRYTDPNLWVFQHTFSSAWSLMCR